MKYFTWLYIEYKKIQDFFYDNQNNNEDCLRQWEFMIERVFLMVFIGQIIWNSLMISSLYTFKMENTKKYMLL